MIIKNKIKTILVLVCFVVIVSSGCSTSKQENPTNNNSKAKSEATMSNKTVTTTEDSKKELELLSFIGKSENDLKKAFGNPNKIDGTENGQVYDYSNFYFTIDDNKAIGIGIKNSGPTINGIGLGTLPKDVKSRIGAPTKETNSNGFIMEYRLNANSISVQYICNDFRSPVKSVTVTDLTFGKEIPMEVTDKKVESLIEGNWILEKNINEKNLSLYIHPFKNGVQDEQLGIWSKQYKITSKNTIMFHYMVNDISGTREEDTEYYIEFYENGDRMEIYVLDKYGDRDSEFSYVYYRYN